MNTTILPSMRPKFKGKQVNSARTGDNCNQLQDLLNLYALPKQRIYDVTWGKGCMWWGIDIFQYKVHASDLDGDKVDAYYKDGLASTGVMDFTNLSYPDLSGDVLILDPPYMGGKQTHESLEEAYNNQNDNHESVIRLYMGGLLEAFRVLKYGGRVFVKCQDETQSNIQCFTHVELIEIMRMMGFDVIDLLVLVNEGKKMHPFAFQRSARKNHSYWIVGMKPFTRPAKKKDAPKKKYDFGFVNENSD